MIFRTFLAITINKKFPFAGLNVTWTFYIVRQEQQAVFLLFFSRCQKTVSREFAESFDNIP